MPRPNRKPATDKPRPYIEIGERIKEFRISQGLDQADIIKVIGGSNVAMTRVESGERQPTVKLLQHLRSLGADLNDIIAGE